MKTKIVRNMSRVSPWTWEGKTFKSKRFYNFKIPALDLSCNWKLRPCKFLFNKVAGLKVIIGHYNDCLKDVGQMRSKWYYIVLQRLKHPSKFDPPSILNWPLNKSNSCSHNTLNPLVAASDSSYFLEDILKQHCQNERCDYFKWFQKSLQFLN